MEEKLIQLFLKFVDKSKDSSEIVIRNRQITCNYNDNGDIHTIYIKPYADTIDANKQKYKIFFQELVEETNHENYKRIFSKVEDKLEEFEKLEKEKRINKQKKLVERLLDNI